MKIGVIMDPIEQVGLDADTTFDWMLAAQKRGHELFYIKPDGLSARDGLAACRAAPVQVRRKPGDHFTLGATSLMPLSALDVCWMRKDPPFDDEYLFATYILELADEAGHCWVLNKPSGLRDANEKAYVLHFPEVTPTTLVTRNLTAIKDFVHEHGGKAVIKPLDGHGGAEVFLLRLDDPNLNTILEVITRLGRRTVMVQQFVPEAARGDKRILLVDGEPLGAVLRVPQGAELRGNLHVGGKAAPATLTPRDLEIVAALAPRLRRDGLYFVGLDVLGDYLTEVNVTSPTGIQEMSRFDDQPYSERWVAWQEARIASKTV